MKNKIWISLCLSAILLAGCDSNGNGSLLIGTSTFITATLPLTDTPAATLTQLPSATPQAVPTVFLQPVEGVTTTQLNLRSEPSTSGEALGTVAAFSTIQIIGRESFGKWVQILDPTSTAGQGWIIASYVQVKESGEIPVIDLGLRGLVLQGVNVRNGPSRDDISLGTLVANDVIGITAKDSSGNWLQVNFKGNPGWVSSEFIQMQGSENLPVVTDPQTEVTSQPVDPGNPSVTALQDHDSPEAPIAYVIMDPAGTGALQLNGFVSQPLDEADWVDFSTSSTRVSIQVVCTGQIQLDLYKNASPIVEDLLKCNETKIIKIEPGQRYTLKLRANAEAFNPLPYSVFINTVR